MHPDLVALESSRNIGHEAKSIRLMLLGKRINMRLVEVEDAHYILRLRMDEGKILSPTENSIEKQVKWLRDYKDRETEKKEYYFIIESKNGSRLGTARIYDL